MSALTNDELLIRLAEMFGMPKGERVYNLRTVSEKFCLDCGKQIVKHCAVRCRSCSMRESCRRRKAVA